MLRSERGSRSYPTNGAVWGDYSMNSKMDGGGGGIRTPGGREPSTVFKTAAIDHSATPPSPGTHSIAGSRRKGLAKAVTAPNRRVAGNSGNISRFGHP